MVPKKIKIRVPKTRHTWTIKPHTRIKPSDKKYDRRRKKSADRETISEALDKTADTVRDMTSAYKFCPQCGAAMAFKRLGDQERLVCSGCDFVFYENPVPAVAIIIPQGERIVLVKRAEKPRRGHWCLPAGFMELNESPQECALREAKEETGLDIRVLKLFGVDVGRDDPRAKVVLIVFLAEIVGGELRAGDDASEAGLFGPAELPLEIAFRTHRRAIDRYFKGHDEQDIGP
jgi:8-oxo-dGTP diphosphatase